MNRILSVFAALCLSVSLFAQIGGGSLVQGFQSGASSTGGSGTVTSVGLTIGGFTVTGSPVTTSGTLAALLASPVANGIVTSTSGGSLQATGATMGFAGNQFTFATGGAIIDSGNTPLIVQRNGGATAAAIQINATASTGGRILSTASDQIQLAAYGGTAFATFQAGSSSVISQWSVSGAAAASAPGILYSGTWYTSGGSGTTTWPALLVQPSGTTTTTWSTSGTGIGVNAASGFAGNLFDLQVNGSDEFRVSNVGQVGISTSGAGVTFNGNGSVSGASGGVTVATASNQNINLSPNGTGSIILGGPPPQTTGIVRTTGPVTITSNVTLANVSGLSVTLAASGAYHFRAYVPTTSAAAGGVQLAIAYGGSASYIWYEGVLTSAGAIVAQTRATSSGGVVCSNAAATAGTGVIEGNIITTTSAAITVQAAQNTSNASALTVLQGAELDVWRDNN